MIKIKEGLCNLGFPFVQGVQKVNKGPFIASLRIVSATGGLPPKVFSSVRVLKECRLRIVFKEMQKLYIYQFLLSDAIHPSEHYFRNVKNKNCY